MCAPGCIIRHLYHHYRGFAATQRRLLEKPEATVKILLYAYRVLLSGTHVLRTGAIEANLGTLLQAHPAEGVAELIARKRGGAEKQPLSPGDRALHDPALDRLEAAMAQAFEDSELPDEVSCRPALDDYVVRARLALGSPA